MEEEHDSSDLMQASEKGRRGKTNQLSVPGTHIPYSSFSLRNSALLHHDAMDWTCLPVWTRKK